MSKDDVHYFFLRLDNPSHISPTYRSPTSHCSRRTSRAAERQRSVYGYMEETSIAYPPCVRYYLL